MAKTIKFKKLKIRGIKKNEIYFPGNGSGSFKDKHGYEFSISSAAAGTMRFFKALSTAEKQFDFFCYAYVRQVIYHPLISTRYPKAFKQFQVMKKTFDYSWNWNVRRTLPSLENPVDEKVITKDGIDLELLKQKFDELGAYTFILYP